MAAKGQEPVFVAEQQDTRSGMREFIIRTSKCSKVASFGKRTASLKNTEKSDGRAGLGGKVRHNSKHTEYKGVAKNSNR